MRVFRNIFRRMGRRLVHKVAYLIFYVIMGFIVWLIVISPDTHNRASKLYQRGEEIYREASADTVPHYDIRQDSFATYIYQN